MQQNNLSSVAFDFRLAAPPSASLQRPVGCSAACGWLAVRLHPNCEVVLLQLALLSVPVPSRAHCIGLALGRRAPRNALPVTQPSCPA